MKNLHLYNWRRLSATLVTMPLLLCSLLLSSCKEKGEPSPEWSATESVWVEPPSWQVTPTDDSPFSMTICSEKSVPGCYMSGKDVISVISTSGECLYTSEVGANIYLYLYVQQPSDEVRTFRLNYYSVDKKCFFISKQTYEFVNDSQLGTYDNMIKPEWLYCGQYKYMEEMKILIVGTDNLMPEDEIAVFSGDVCRTTGPITVTSNDANALQLSMFVPMQKVKESFEVRYYDSRRRTISIAQNVEIGYQHSGVGTAIFTIK